MFYLTLIIPAALSIIMLLFFSRKVNLYEHGLLWFTSIITYFIMSSVMLNSNMQDTEYLSTLGVKVRYYEDWNEYIHKRCSYQTCTGSGKHRHCRTHYYDCSYVKYHNEYWTIIDQYGSEYHITSSEYNKLKDKWKSESQFVEMNRNYHSNDGDAYDFYWNKVFGDSRLIASSESYENRTQAATSLFKFSDISIEEAQHKKLFEYPKIINNYQPTILGANFSDHTKNNIDYLNSSLGKQKQVKVFFLYFWDQPRQIAFDQKNYWRGGNKNELIICIGASKKDKKVQWVETFSWCKNPIVEVRVKSWYASNPNFNLNKLQPELNGWILSDWKRREFTDFKYINIELSTTQTVLLWILLSIINLGVSLYVICNDHDNDLFEIKYKK